MNSIRHLQLRFKNLEARARAQINEHSSKPSISLIRHNRLQVRTYSLRLKPVWQPPINDKSEEVPSYQSKRTHTRQLSTDVKRPEISSHQLKGNLSPPVRLIITNKLDDSGHRETTLGISAGNHGGTKGVPPLQSKVQWRSVRKKDLVRRVQEPQFLRQYPLKKSRRSGSVSQRYSPEVLQLRHSINRFRRKFKALRLKTRLLQSEVQRPLVKIYRRSARRFHKPVVSSSPFSMHKVDSKRRKHWRHTLTLQRLWAQKLASFDAPQRLVPFFYRLRIYRHSNVDEGAQLSTFWNRRFSLLCASHKVKSPPKVSSSAKSSIPSATRSNAEPNSRNDQIWLVQMLRLLRLDPYQALQMLIATSFSPFPPGYAVNDSVEFIISQYLDQGRQSDLNDIQALLTIIMRLLDRGPAAGIELTNRTIYTLLQHLNAEQAKSLYEKLEEHRHPISPHTAVHFAEVFAKSQQTRMAMKVVQWLRENTKADFSDPVIMAACSTILVQKNRSQLPDSPSDSETLGFMVDCGLHPNTITYNILIHNAIQRGDSDTARDIHRVMINNGIDPDAYTYSILLNDAKYRLYRNEIDRIFEITSSSNMIDEHLATDFLHAHQLQVAANSQGHSAYPRNTPWALDSSTRSAPTPALNETLSFFAKTFDTTALRKLIPNFPDLAPTVESPKKLPPNRQALRIMIMAIFKQLTTPTSIHELYKNFRAGVASQDADLLKLTKRTDVYDAAITAFGKHAVTLNYCTTVLADMLASHNADPETHAAPSLYTWSILIKVFMDHRQPLAAEKVLTMMQSQGIEPNQVTWNKLMIGYARLQNVAGAVGALERARKAGFGLGKGVMGTFGAMERRGELFRAIDRLESGGLRFKKTRLELEEERVRIEEELERQKLVDDDDDEVDDERVGKGVDDNVQTEGSGSLDPEKGTDEKTRPPADQDQDHDGGRNGLRRVDLADFVFPDVDGDEPLGKERDDNKAAGGEIL